MLSAFYEGYALIIRIRPYQNSLVLINKLHIQDADTLTQAESQIYDAKILIDPPTGIFDYRHLQALHKHLFAEIYDWAGEARTVNVAKNTNYAGVCNV